MKKIIISAIALLGVLVSCQKQDRYEPNTDFEHVAAVRTMAPAPDESGTVKVYTGSEIKLEGINLDQVCGILIDETAAEIITQELKTITFEVPDMGFPQSDKTNFCRLYVLGKTKTDTVYRKNFYITVPVTDALVSGFTPESGTVGTEISIKGRNLEQLTSVKFGDTKIAAADFSSAAAGAVSFKVPAGTYEAGNSSITITATWAGGDIAVTSAEKAFTMKTPKVTAGIDASKTYMLGDEFSISGENLDLTEKLAWGSDELLIVQKSASKLDVKVPTSIDKKNPVLASAALEIVWAEGALRCKVADAMKIDTTPVGPAKPIITSVAPADKGYDKIYLAKKVTVTGQNMASVTAVKIDGIEAEASDVTDVAASFIVPVTISGSAKKTVDVAVVYAGGSLSDAVQVDVYPFYCNKGVKIGIGSNSKSTFPAFNEANAFFQPRSGKVYGTADFIGKVDPFPSATGNAVITGANKAATGKETEYYSVEPYIFANSNSSHKLAFENPTNTPNNLKTFFVSGVALPASYGTPSMFYGITSGDLKASVVNGTISDMSITEDIMLAGSSAPAFGTAEGSTWVKGSVLIVEYLKYDHLSTTGGKPTAASQIKEIGYVYVKDVTCGDPSTGLALTTREGYIEMDVYWSK